MSKWIVNSENSLQVFIGDIRESFREHKFLQISVKFGTDRSLDQNAVSHVWYAQLARELRDHDELGWKCYCKLHLGVPILRAEDEEFRRFYGIALMGLSYEQKIEAMKFVPVTSNMTKPQLNKYLKAMQDEFDKQGVLLEFKKEDDHAKR